VCALCSDIDECSPSRVHLHTCARDSVCTNSPGSYTCTCPPGFTGLGHNCTGKRTSLSAPRFFSVYYDLALGGGWLGSRVASVLDSGAEGPGFKSQPRRCRVTFLDKLFTPIVPLFTKQ